MKKYVVGTDSGGHGGQRALVRWIVEDSRPLSIVDTDAFRAMFRALTRSDKPPPTRKTISTHITKTHQLAVDLLRNELSTSQTLCAVSTDGWLSPATQEFLCACVHYITPDWRLKYYLLKVVPMHGDVRADIIRAKLQSIFTEYGIKPHTIVCDQGANYACAVDGIFSCQRFICVAHNMNLVVCDVTRGEDESPDPNQWREQGNVNPNGWKSQRNGATLR